MLDSGLSRRNPVLRYPTRAYQSDQTSRTRQACRPLSRAPTTPTLTPQPYSPPASGGAQNPKVAFAKDVMPIFAKSCAFTSCHGSTGAANGVFLGGTDPARVHQAIVDVRSSVLPANGALSSIRCASGNQR